MDELISRQQAIDALDKRFDSIPMEQTSEILLLRKDLRELPSVEPKRIWHPCSEPPIHHRDVIVKGVEAISNKTVYKVMQWDVNRWRPTDYAPSIMWKEWSEI